VEFRQLPIKTVAPPDAKRRRALGQILLLSAALVVLIVISAGSIYLVNKARDENALVVHTIEVENQVNALMLEVRRAESAARGYLLTLGPEFLEDYNSAVAAIRPEVDRLAQQTRDNPVQVQNVSKLRSAIDTRLDQFAREMDLLKQNDPAAAAALVREATAQNTTGMIRNVAEAMILEEARLFLRRSLQADRSQSLAASMTWIGSGLVIVLAAISMWIVRLSARARDKAEAQLRDTNVNLEATVDERTADLREANAEIQRFAYIVSHDLRSPLVNIMGFTSELEQLRSDVFKRIAHLSRAAASAPASPSSHAEPEPELDEKDKQLADDFGEALGFIKSSIGKMDRLISAILNLTREGRREFEPVEIDTHELIDSVVATLAHQAAEAGAEIHIEALPRITSDRLALEQIFSNLIDNAIKYLKPGVAGDIRVRGRTRLGYAIFEVSDNGRGIDPKDHQRIFDLFRRAGTQDKPGQGIGLAHVRALVRRLGGTMSVSSELGTGSTFTITLPVKWAASGPKG
jgi:signal transduction histidine kinase